MEIYKSFGLLSIILIWAGLLYMIKKWPGNKSMSFSAHAAASRPGIVYYFTLFTTDLILFFLFVSKWLVPTLHLPYVFTTISFIAVLGQFIAICIPTTGGLKTRIHDLSSYVMFVLLMPLSLMLFYSSHVSLVARLACLLAACYMVVAWFLFTIVKSTKNHFLIYQTTYAASFHVALLLVIYTR